ncbi:MAG: sigma-70 family RNA polymerase sigma factor [Ruminococcus sp.]|nr:sigma-70 family RNA polymerase sigma factor [Ruminococcus sp.]
MEDKEIIGLFFEREERAVDETMKKYGARLRRLALSFLGDEGDAEECVSDAMLNVWRTIPPNKPDELFGYLARLTRCRAFNLIERRRAAKRSAQLVELTKELSECIPDPTQSFEKSELTELINSFLTGLKPEKRRVFVLRYMIGYSIKEISKETGFSESKLKTLLLRLRKQLKDYLKEKGVKL